MENVRCRCGKILCQAEGDFVPAGDLPQDTVILIKCRHCKRFIAIHTKGLIKVEYVDQPGHSLQPLKVST